MKLRVKNWADFQHYKDRCPPWIKLHKNLLDDYEFHCLPVASRALAPCLWLIASEDLEGVIDANTEKLAFRLRQTQKQIDDALTPLIEKGFFIKEQSASNALADRNQDAPLDRGETEAEKSASRQPVGLQTLIDLGVAEQHAKDWLKVRKAKRAPLTQTVIDDIRAQADKAGISFPKAIEICAKKSWQGFNASWDFGDTKTQDDWRKEINES
jgi:hypothetical protein